MKRIWLIAFFCLSACSPQSWIDRFSSPEERALAVKVAQEIRDGRASQLEDETQPQIRKQILTVLPQLAKLLKPVVGPFTIETINSVTEMGGPTTKTFILQAGSGSHWATVQVTLQGSANRMELAGVYVTPYTSDPLAANDFSIEQRGPIGYFWLTIILASAVTCIWAVVLIWRHRWLKRRWLWTIGSLLGFTNFLLNWTTGGWTVLPIHVSLLGAGATKVGPYTPWILSFGIPVVAIIVIVRWYRRDNDAAEAI